MTLKVDTVTNVAGTGAPNATDGVTVGGTALSSVTQMEYTSSANPPDNPANGAVWWSTGDEQMFLYVNDAWYEIASSPPPPAFFGTRGLFAGGNDGSVTDRVDYVTIASPGNATDFGNLSAASMYGSGASNGTRGCFAIAYLGGSTYVNTIDYFTVANTGNATDFGDLTNVRYNTGGNHGVTRGLFGGGNVGPPYYSKSGTIDYITIATTGNATSFGNLSNSRERAGTASDATRALWAGGGGPSNTIDYVTVDTPGNATDFGDLSGTITSGAGVGNGTYGIFKYGSNYTDELNVVTIQTTGNATLFGVLVRNRFRIGGNVGDGTYGLFAGGRIDGGSRVNDIDVITVATSGNATDFGNLTLGRDYLNGFQGT